MPIQKLSKQEIRKIIKIGDSFSVTIPIEILRALGWKEKQKVTVKKTRGGFVVRDWKK